MLIKVTQQGEVRTGPQSWAVRAVFPDQFYDLPDDQAQQLLERGHAERVAGDTGGAGAAAAREDPPPNGSQTSPSAARDDLHTQLNAMTVKELRGLAEASGIAVASGAKKAEIVALIEAHQQDQEPATPAEDTSGEG